MASCFVARSASKYDPSRSHFDAMHFMETATPNGIEGYADGWISRYLAGVAPTVGPFLRALSLGPALPTSYAAAPGAEGGVVRTRQRADSTGDGALDTIASLVWHCVLMLDADTIFIGGGLASLGGRVSEPVRSRLDAVCATSPFLASYRAAERVRTTAVDVEYGVLGASWLVRSA